MISYDAVHFISGIIAFVVVGLSLLYLLRETWWRQIVEDVRTQAYEEGWDAACEMMESKKSQTTEQHKESKSHA